jgi:dihydrofolate reductase
MSTVYSHMTMSLDGYIADPDDRCDKLFGWYGAGDVTVPSAADNSAFQVDEDSASFLREMLADTGALVCGRRLFDITEGWGDNHPVGAPVFVVTHGPPADADRWPRTTFIENLPDAVAVARDIAGGKNVVVASASVAAQALDLGLLDAVSVSLVPVVLGSGIPYFAKLTGAPHRFEDPVVVAGRRATHLTYAVRR